MFLKGLKMINLHNFTASLKCTWIKRLSQCLKPWVDIFKTINGNDFQKRLIDFGDGFLSDKLQRNYIFLARCF